jgi:hypothetical protein
MTTKDFFNMCCTPFVLYAVNSRLIYYCIVREALYHDMRDINVLFNRHKVLVAVC